ncbi:MAG: transporter substrate-binding domain-containing protein [Synergistaceae bacterium]|nr:transporter substrate-binding domain-containing protein [Synergistaceae bacterium]
MKKITILIVLLYFVMNVLAGVPAFAGNQGLLGRLTKLNVDEDTLNADIADFFFSHMPFSGYKFYDTLDSMVMALQSGIITGIATDEFTKDYIISKNSSFVEYKNPEAPSHVLAYAMMLRNSDSELCNRITSVIRDMQSDGTLDSLKKQYIDDVIAGVEPEATVPETMKNAETNGAVIKVALTGDRPPMDYFSESGKPIGFNTAIVLEIAKRLGLNVEFISADSGARAVALASGAADIVFWSENGNFNNREKADIEDQPDGTVITEPYLAGKLSYIVLASSPLAGQ